MIAVLLAALTLAGYLWAARAYGRRYPRRHVPWLNAAAFVAGTLLASAALLPAVDAWVDRSFAAHMVQHLALAFVVPPLLLLGQPLLLALGLLPTKNAKALAHAVRHPAIAAVTSPVFAWLFFVAVLWGMHFSPLYELALRFEPVHVAEHALLFTAALLFWMPVVQVGYVPHPVPFPARLLYLFLALPQGAFLGLAIYSSRRILYAHYLTGQSFSQALLDQQYAGAVMWIGGGALLFCAFMATAATWAAREREEAVA